MDLTTPFNPSSAEAHRFCAAEAQGYAAVHRSCRDISPSTWSTSVLKGEGQQKKISQRGRFKLQFDMETCWCWVRSHPVAKMYGTQISDQQQFLSLHNTRYWTIPVIRQSETFAHGTSSTTMPCASFETRVSSVWKRCSPPVLGNIQHDVELSLDILWKIWEESFLSLKPCCWMSHCWSSPFTSEHNVHASAHHGIPKTFLTSF